MDIFYALLTAYLVVGVVLNFFGPLSRMIWVEQMRVLTQDDVSKKKYILFMTTIRIGVVFFYPLFLFKG